MHDQSRDTTRPERLSPHSGAAPNPGRARSDSRAGPGRPRTNSRADASRDRELTELYEALAPRLERIVRLDVRAPEAVIEDACQCAWSRLVDHFDRVRRDATLSWLATTAVREAFRSIRRARRELSLEVALNGSGSTVLETNALAPDELIEQGDRLGSLRTLPYRQQRLLWLQGLGLSYREMAHHERCTRRTVERQLLRAKGSLRARAAAASRPSPGLAR